MLGIYSPIAAIIVFATAVASAGILVRWFGAPAVQGRFVPIDGLRGYLALSVFLHHSSIWFSYLRSGQWLAPPSNVYTQFGEVGVALFFMITGFLFSSKLFEARHKPFDWTRLFVSRIFRLVPLYALAMVLLFSIVAYLSHGTLNRPPREVVLAALQWMAFSIFGRPDINGIVDTMRIVAGVTWTLAYEWFFYLSLPVLALTLRVRVPTTYLILGAVSLMLATLWRPTGFPVMSFGSGVVAALFVRYEAFRAFATKPLASVLALACLLLALCGFHTITNILAFELVTVAFVLIAGGASFFGALNHPYSRLLGSMAYSVYLLHGVMLFVLFTFLLGQPRAATLSPILHWLSIVLATPVLVASCFATFRLVEAPGIRLGPAALSWLRGIRASSQSGETVTATETVR